MTLSENTIRVLKNFATINPSIKILPGKELTTVAEARNILSKASIEDEFPQEFGIYDLGSFISTLGLVDTPNLKFDEKYVTIFDSTGRSKIRYFFDANQEGNTNQVIMPHSQVAFTLTPETFSKIKRAASTLGHNQISITPNNGTLAITVLNEEDPTSNTFTIEVDADKQPVDAEFNFIFNISNLKLMEGTYTVNISEKLISNFVNTENAIEYFIAVERTSTYKENN